MVKETIPYKTVRRILKTHTNSNVTRESVIFVKEYVENLLIDISKKSIKEQEEQNRLRKFHNLPKHKRFHIFIFKRVLAQLLKEQPDFKVGEVARYSRETTLSDKADLEVV